MEGGSKRGREPGAGDFGSGCCNIVFHTAQDEGLGSRIQNSIGRTPIEIAGLTDGTGIDQIAAISFQSKLVYRRAGFEKQAVDK